MRTNALICALGVLVAFFFMLRPIDDFDIFTQVLLGQSILEHGLWPPESLSYYLQERALGSHLSNPGWLWQLAFSWVSSRLDWILFSLLHCAAFVSAFMVMLSTKFSPEDQKAAPLLEATILWVLTVANNTSIRPQVLTLLFLALAFRTLLAKRLRPYHWLLFALLLVVWQNVHLSLVLVAPLILARFVRHFENPSEGLPRIVFETVGLVGIWSMALIATPLGIEVFSISRSNYEITHDIFQNLEWFALWEYGFSAMWGFLFSLAVTIPLLGMFWRSISVSQWVLCLSYTLLAVCAARFALIWAFMMLPLWVLLFGKLTEHFQFRVMPSLLLHRVGRGFRVGTFCMLVILSGLGVLKRPLFTEKIPFRCLDNAPEKGKAFVYREWAGPLMFYRKGEVMPLSDGRLYLYSPDFWRHYFEILSGRVNLKEVQQAYDPDFFMLHRKEAEGLFQRLEESPQWGRSFQSELCALYEKI